MLVSFEATILNFQVSPLHHRLSLGSNFGLLQQPLDSIGHLRVLFLFLWWILDLDCSIGVVAWMKQICHDMFVLSFWGRVIYHLKLRQMHQFVLVWRSVELVANYGFGFGALLERFDSDIRAEPMTTTLPWQWWHMRGSMFRKWSNDFECSRQHSISNFCSQMGKSPWTLQNPTCWSFDQSQDPQSCSVAPEAKLPSAPHWQHSPLRWPWRCGKSVRLHWLTCPWYGVNCWCGCTLQSKPQKCD